MESSIRGTTQVLGVMGWPVAHSRSPVFQNAAIRALGIDAVYVPMPVAPERLAEAVHGLRALGCRGASVTIPHKVSVMALMDQLSPLARAIGAVNTIVVESDGRLVGHNTDCEGALEALATETGVRVAGEDVLILGAGGAAQALAWGSAHHGARSVWILNRTRERAEALARELLPHFPDVHIRALDGPEASEVAEARVVFQMTSLGMKAGDALPVDPARLRLEAVGLEAVYSPLETPWLKGCRSRGLKIVDGLQMLVAQGARAFELWFGQPAPVDVMRRALLERS